MPKGRARGEVQSSMTIEGRKPWHEVGGPFITLPEGTFNRIPYVTPTWPEGHGPKVHLFSSPDFESIHCSSRRGTPI